VESKAFRICPFCQSPTPLGDERCSGCRRSLAGLTLPVYGSALDAAMGQPAPDLVDLPLREDAPGPVPDVVPEVMPDVVPAAVASAAPRPAPATARTERRRVGRGAKAAVGTTLLAVLVAGGWLLREAPPSAQEEAAPSSSSRPSAPRHATARVVPTTEVPATSSVAPSPVPRARPTPRLAAVAPPLRAPLPRVAPPAERETDTNGGERRADDGDRPAARVYTLHPDVRSGPVDVERAEGDFHPRLPAAEPIEPPDAAAQAGLRQRLARAEARRDVLADRVASLRERTNVRVIRNLQDYEAAQADLSAALDALDRADSEVARLRGLIGRN